jgi:hypothetical protein
MVTTVDFTLTSQQTELQQSVLAFAQRELGGDMRAREKEGAFFWDGWRACASFGIQALPVPREHGGLGEDIVTCMLAMQALGKSCRDSGLLFALGSHMWTCEIPILAFGSDEQKRTYLPRLAAGEIIGAHAMTEPEAGSDAYSLRTAAVADGDHYVLNGTKTFISNAPIADLLLVFATTNPAKGWAGITGFLIPTTTPGVSVGKPIEKLGLKTAPTGEVVLEDCRVPASAMLGKPGQGSAIFSAEMEWERSCLFACHLGAMERQLETCIRYAKDRKQFGNPIGSFQAISHKIADMKVRLELGELILHKVAWLKSQGKRAAMEAAIAKLFVSESYVTSSLDAIQLHGGYGFTTEYEVERDLRDAVGGKLYSGTSEIQRNLIASLLGL